VLGVSDSRFVSDKIYIYVYGDIRLDTKECATGHPYRPKYQFV